VFLKLQWFVVSNKIVYLLKLTVIKTYTVLNFKEMITSELYNKATIAINVLHEQDVKHELVNGIEQPAEFSYSQRMLETLKDFTNDADLNLQLAVQCQHLQRWKIARSLFPMDKPGYFQWRKAVMASQLAITTETLQSLAVDIEDITDITDILSKKGKEADVRAQIIEDVACIVFVQWYLEDFAAQHDFDKVVDIVRKTIKKMSSEGLRAVQTKPLSLYVTKVLQAL
jgi:hypothetical protein